MIRVFDLHDTAYYVWRDAGVRGATLVHVDAHHDIERAEDSGAIHVGNFVRAALVDGLVAEVFWVVPDPMWADPESRRWMLDELAHHGAETPRPDGACLRTRFEGVPVWIGTLDALPVQHSKVLLDIDVDYLLTAARHEGAENPLPAPWCMPEQLLGRLRARGVRPEIVTIATSVTGGFTPLRWQHLGRELAGLPSAGAEAHYQRAETLQARGALDEARAAFGRALDIDPTYRHPFRTRGFCCLKRNRLPDAAREFVSGLALDPADPYARVGLAMIALRRGDAPEAARLAELSLGAVDSLDGWRTAGTAAARLGDRTRALHAYVKAMRHSLNGETSLIGTWAANPDRRLADPGHWRDHVGVADLHSQAGDLDAALAHYRIAAACAPGKPWIRLRLASALARRRES